MASNSTQKQTLKRQPKNTGRRSKEEREALEKDANERRQARLNAIEADKAAESAQRKESQRSSYGTRDTGRGRGTSSFQTSRGRGGFMGTRPDTQDQSHIVGPSAVKEDGKPAQGSLKVQKPRSANTRSQASRAKKEPVVKADPDGDVPMDDVSEVLKTQVDGGYISSDPDEGAEGPRQDVNTMLFPDTRKLASNMHQDGDDDDDGDDDPVRTGAPSQPGKMSAVPGPQLSVQPNLPIRIPRRRHEDRKVLINRDIKLPTYAENRKQPEDVEVVGDFPEIAMSSKSFPKRKTRTRGTRAGRDGRTPPGDHDDEDNEMQGVDVKDETEHNPSINPATDTFNQSSNSIRESPDDPIIFTTDNKSKGKQKKKLDNISHSAGFASIEEQLESRIKQNEFRDLRHELGPVHMVETSVSRSGAPSRHPGEVDNKANNVYLFQLPPILPELRTTDVIKPDTQSPESGKVPNLVGKRGQVKETEEEVVKVEDVEGAEQTPKSRVRNVFDYPGKIGKLRVHESGKASLSWGGTSMELSMGINASFLQTAVLAKVKKADSGVLSEEYGGDVMSFGQVRGKFVMTPDWKDVFS